MFMNIRRPLAFGAAGFAILTLAACSDLFGDDTSAPANSPFSQALAKNYTDLANQTAAVPAPAAENPDEGMLDSTMDFLSNPFGLFGSDNSNDLLVQAYTDKASLAEQGQEPAPEPAPANPDAQGLHDRLVRAVAAGKERFPEPAARAQADYDCWVLDANAPGMGAESQACRTAFDRSLVALESAARPAPPPATFPVAPVAPIAPPPPVVAAAASSDFTAYFDFDSWTLTAEDLTVITNVINTARAGGQSRITVVGHTDTVGGADFNQRLSVRRANVVVEALVDMGARRAAIQASGVGKTDLAVQTPDQTREARNRRTVIGLSP
jgi:outer membrane protein OmpA-like peptidoglycan-associated protein